MKLHGSELNQIAVERWYQYVLLAYKAFVFEATIGALQYTAAPYLNINGCNLVALTSLLWCIQASQVVADKWSLLTVGARVDPWRIK